MYSEIEGEDGVYTSLNFEMVRTLYKGSGYVSFTGGALKNLRENTTHQMVIEINDLRISGKPETNFFFVKYRSGG